MPTTSIIICTRNRAESLRPTLASLANVAMPEGMTGEVIIVDNGSTDHTAEVVRSARLPGLAVAYEFEPTPGQCYARNRGLARASGEVIQFTDDDIRFPRDWIAGMVAPIVAGLMDAAAGGVVFPPAIDARFRGPALQARKGWFASTERLDPVSPGVMVGANLAFHRRVLAKVPEFDVELGPGRMGFYDETLFAWRLVDAGFALGSCLETKVEHHFDTSRLAPDHLVATARKMGESQAYVDHHWEHRVEPLLMRRLTKALVLRQTSRFRRGAFAGEISDELLVRELSMAYYTGLFRLRGQPFKYEREGSAGLRRAA